MQIITAAGMEITESQWPCILLQLRYLPAGKLSTLGCLAGWLDSLTFPLTENWSKDLKKSMGQDRSKPTDPIHSFVCILVSMVLSTWKFFSEQNRYESYNTSESLFKNILSE